MTWEELCEKAKELDWYSVKPEKEEVDIKCINKDYQYFQFKYDEFLCHEDIPLRFYKNGLIFFDDNDIDKFPHLIQSGRTYDQLYQIMLALR